MTSRNLFWSLVNGAKLKHVAMNFHDAVAGYTEALPFSTSSLGTGQARLFRGLSYRALSQYADAIADYDAVLEIATTPLALDRVPGLLFRGCAKAVAGDASGAEADFRLLPTETLSREDNDLVIRPVAPHDLERAADDLTAFINTRPNEVAGYFCRGVVNRSLSRWTDALSDFEATAALDPASTRLATWARTQAQVQHGVPNRLLPNALRPDVAYVSLDYARDAPAQVTITHFSHTGVSRTETLDLTAGQSMHDALRQDGWMLLHRAGHQEGDTWYYWRPTP